MEAHVRKTLDLLKSIDAEAQHANQLVLKIQDKLSSQKKTEDNADSDDEDSFASQDREEGIGLLHLKNLLMADYLQNLVYLAAVKTEGGSIKGDQAIERIVEDRTVLEKIKPMEKKLKYQIDKYIRLADHAEASENDPLHFKPNLQSLAAGSDEDSDDDDDQDDDGVAASAGDNGEKGANKKYVVPKHVPALCPDDESTRADMEREGEARAKKQKLSKAIMEDLKRQYLDTPEEEFNHSDHVKAKQLAEMRERTRYEEDNYMRLPALSKKEKHRQRKSMTTVTSVGKELTYFGSNNFFNESGAGGDNPRSSGKKRKSTNGKKSSSVKKKFKRRQ